MFWLPDTAPDKIEVVWCATSGVTRAREKTTSHVVIIDTGSALTKACVAGSRPLQAAVLRTGDVVGTPTDVVRDQHIGSVDAVARLWGHVIRVGLGLDPTSTEVVVSGPADPTNDDAERTAEVLFEVLGVRAGVMVQRPLLALWRRRTLEGLVVDAGHDSTRGWPVVEGHVILAEAFTYPVGGRGIEAYLCTLLRQMGYTVPKDLSMEDVRRMKEELCTVRLTGAEGPKYTTTGQDAFTTPEGLEVDLGPITECAAEPLFDPAVLGIDERPLGEMVAGVIGQDRDFLLKIATTRNIVVTGGMSLLPGYVERLRHETRQRVGDDVEFKMRGSEDATMDTCMGGYIFGTLRTTRKLLVTKERLRTEGAWQLCPL